MKHHQLTSTLIGKRLMGILQSEPNMKVRTIMRIVENVFVGEEILRPGGGTHPP
jgi:hypothetical protein